jgi:hypothetical protein
LYRALEREGGYSKLEMCRKVAVKELKQRKSESITDWKKRVRARQKTINDDIHKYLAQYAEELEA